MTTFVKPLINDVTVWEIWNEPNLNGFFNGNSDAYADLLHTAYVTIHAATVGGDLDGRAGPGGQQHESNNAIPYWTRVYNWNAAQGRSGSVGLFDVMAHHAYLYPEDPTNHANDHDWSGFYQAKLIHDLMVSKGDGAKKVWGTDKGAPSGCTYAQCITIDEAAGASRRDGPLDRRVGFLHRAAHVSRVAGAAWPNRHRALLRFHEGRLVPQGAAVDDHKDYAAT